jgi:hypothetical protein
MDRPAGPQPKTVTDASCGESQSVQPSRWLLLLLLGLCCSLFIGSGGEPLPVVACPLSLGSVHLAEPLSRSLLAGPRREGRPSHNLIGLYVQSAGRSEIWTRMKVKAGRRSVRRRFSLVLHRHIE